MCYPSNRAFFLWKINLKRYLKLSKPLSEKNSVLSMESINSLSAGSAAYFYIDFQGEFLYGFSPTKQALITPLYSISLRRKPL